MFCQKKRENEEQEWNFGGFFYRKVTKQFLTGSFCSRKKENKKKLQWDQWEFSFQYLQ